MKGQTRIKVASAPRSPLTERCPYCYAPPGEECVSKNGEPAKTHRPRERMAIYVPLSDTPSRAA